MADSRGRQNGGSLDLMVLITGLAAVRADVVLLADGGVRVCDDGVGLPVGMKDGERSWKPIYRTYGRRLRVE